MNGYFEQTFLLRTADTDLNGEWRASSIFQAMQDVANAHCEGYNLGMNALREQNLAWVVNRARVRMESMPRMGDTVTVRTWPKSPQHYFFPRYFQFWSANSPVGSAATLYVQLDLTTRRMAKPWLGGNEELTSDLEPALPLPGGIALPDTPTETFIRTARYADLDMNGHVNNARYLDWLCDCIDIERHRAWTLRDMLIHYNREILPEERVELAMQWDGARSVMRGLSDGQTCFVVQGDWMPRTPER